MEKKCGSDLRGLCILILHRIEHCGVYEIAGSNNFQRLLRGGTAYSEIVYQKTRLADTDGNALSVFTARSNTRVEAHVTANHFYPREHVWTISY